ncbi:uncharacterized protein LOC121288859 [Carcharodon carcharias]|uniref:TNF superfamily member 4 n=1 Tax=Carcharodon carcharias TaxID=13397 RepID=UPI001B7E07E1|nr:TNF superfamily member 4 [Carcharodon carcharias]
MDEVIDMREDAVREVAIQRQRRRFPFEIFNILLTVICLATAALVVYRLFQSPVGGHRMDSFMFVIHAKAASISQGKVTFNSNNSAWVKNNAIVVPCDGLYLVYAHAKPTNVDHPTRVTIKKGVETDSQASWLLLDSAEQSPLITSSLRVNNMLHMELNVSTEDFDEEVYLGIALLQVHQDIVSCQEIIQKSCKKKRSGMGCAL